MSRVVCLASVTLWACGPGGQSTTPSKATTSAPAAATFEHARHVGARRPDGRPVGCRDCHTSTVETDFVTMRPGVGEHAPCDDCHKEAFYAAPGPMCQVCHTSALDALTPRKGGGATLVEFPRRSIEAELVGAFNHAAHLDEGRVRAPDGKALRCDSCHAISNSSPYVSIPTHADCAPCHAPANVARVKAPHSLEDCGGCHTGGGPGRARRFARDNDVRFSHAKHTASACVDCHASVVRSTNTTDRAIPVMAVCAECHANPDKTSPELRIRKDNCGLCHVDDPASKGLPGDHTGGSPQRWPGALAQATPAPSDTASDVVPPLHHMLPSPFDPPARGAIQPVVPVPAGAVQATPLAKPLNPNVRPQDHTPLFRRRHEQAASAPSAQCHQCHSGLSGSRRDSCQDCHAVSRPKSHTLRFRSVAHGREAARDPKACASCHEVDYCAECHAQRPPSHRGDFELRHDRVARLNPRACMTCHTFESTCVDCHSGGIE